MPGEMGDIHAIQFTYDKNNKVLKKSKENELLVDYYNDLMENRLETPKLD